MTTELVLKSRTDVEDFVRGCTFYGTGGGGKPTHGMRLLLEDLERIGEIAVSDRSVVRDDAWTCTPFLMGSIAPATPETAARLENAGLGRRIGMADRVLTLAVQELRAYVGFEIEAIVPIELGGGNTPAAIDAAMSLGKKVINGDFAGRAIPEIAQGTPNLANMPSHPTAYADEWGNVSIVKTAVNYQLAESLGKMISVAAVGLAGGAGLLMRAKEMKELVIPNTLGECLIAGQTIRSSVAAKKDPSEALAEATGGWVLFRGAVIKKEWEDRDGYMWGTNTIDGHGNHEGHTFKIFYKNENHVSWLDDKPLVTSPDLITVMRSDTGEPITNTEIREGDFVSVIGLRGRRPFETPEGLRILGPKHFGYDIEHVSIEKLAKENRLIA